MRNKTCENAADDIIAAGGGRELIVQVMNSIFAHGYSKGYGACTGDANRRKEGKKHAAEASFKKEMDTIDDVRTAKWA